MIKHKDESDNKTKIQKIIGIKQHIWSPHQMFEKNQRGHNSFKKLTEYLDTVHSLHLI